MTTAPINPKGHAAADWPQQGHAPVELSATTPEPAVIPKKLTIFLKRGDLSYASENRFLDQLYRSDLFFFRDLSFFLNCDIKSSKRKENKKLCLFCKDCLRRERKF